MNARKSATSVPSTISRLLKSNAFLKTPPPAYYPILSNPPAPSLVRFLAPRPTADLPPSLKPQLTPFQSVKLKFDAGATLTPQEDRLLLEGQSPAKVTRRKPPRTPHTKKSRPMPIVFPEDRIREQFFRDHPFEAYRPVLLAEAEVLAAVREPYGVNWTALGQRSRVPSAEDAISFVTSLHEFHHIPLEAAYTMSISQFRSLRSEHEMANRSSRLQAEAHGAIFYGEIQKGINLEEKVLDEWINAREINAAIQAKQAERGGSGGIVLSGISATSETVKAMSEDQYALENAAVGTYTGGVDFVARFANRNRAVVEEQQDDEADDEDGTTA